MRDNTYMKSIESATPGYSKIETHGNEESLSQHKIKLEHVIDGTISPVGVWNTISEMRQQLATQERSLQEDTWLNEHIVPIGKQVFAYHDEHTDLTTPSNERDTLIDTFESIIHSFPDRKQELLDILPEHLHSAFLTGDERKASIEKTQRQTAKPGNVVPLRPPEKPATTYPPSSAAAS